MLLIWLGLKKFDASKYTKTVISLLDSGLLIVSTVKLGWLGVGVVAAANFIGAVVYSVRLAVKKDSLLTSAAAQSGTSKEALEELYEQLRREHQVFKVMSPIERAQLIYFLSRRGRNESEIIEMAVPIAMLWFAREMELRQLVDRFDRLMRLYDKEASEAMDLANTLTASTQGSAATLDDMIEALTAFHAPE